MVGRDVPQQGSLHRLLANEPQVAWFKQSSMKASASRHGFDMPTAEMLGRLASAAGVGLFGEVIAPNASALLKLFVETQQAQFEYIRKFIMESESEEMTGGRSQSSACCVR